MVLIALNQLLKFLFCCVCAQFFEKSKTNTLSLLFIIWRNIEAILASIYELIAKASSSLPTVSDL